MTGRQRAAADFALAYTLSGRRQEEDPRRHSIGPGLPVDPLIMGWIVPERLDGEDRR
jgi:hypothetical protein